MISIRRTHSVFAVGAGLAGREPSATNAQDIMVEVGEPAGVVLVIDTVIFPV
jgi:hypothetical protein